MLRYQIIATVSLLLTAPVDPLKIVPGDEKHLRVKRAKTMPVVEHAQKKNRSDRGNGPKNVTNLLAAPTMLDQPTGRPSKRNTTAAQMTGITENSEGDLNAFLTALITNVVLIVVFFLIASVLRQRYPNVYSWNSEKGPKDDPERWEKLSGKETDTSFFGWWKMSATVTIDEVVEKRGLDIGMLLQFSEDAMSMLFYIGLPLVLFVCPQHAFMGGYRAGNDYLSYLGMANVVDGHPFLYWEHAILVWLVVVFVELKVWSSYKKFKERRVKWLKAMPPPRSTTVLVEFIPTKYQKQKELKDHMNKIFRREDAVKDVMVVKKTKDLLTSISDRDKEKDLYDQEKHKLEEMKKPDSATDSATLLSQEGEVTKAEAKLKTRLDEIDIKRGEIMQESKESEVNLTTAFITFYYRRDAELAKQMLITSEEDVFEISVPPEPSDVIYADLQKDPNVVWIRALLGYGLIAGVFWAYLPTVVGIAYYTSLETLRGAHIKFVKDMASDPEFVALWDGLMCSLALTLFTSFVPTMFVFIFSNFFILKAEAWLQVRIQFWYFYFQVVFILLVTTIGNSLLGMLKEISHDPGSVFYLLATTLPMASHFYLNFLPLQWVTHAQNLMRISNLFKYKAWSLVYGEDKGKEKSEPEDQDYYGLGSRSARFTFMLVLTLTFCLLSPLIAMLGWINFWVCRKVYGYLCVYAETKKPDLGGAFYIPMLQHVQEGLLLFILLMSGVLTMRDRGWAPGVIAGSALVYQTYAYKKFIMSLRWESLSFEEMMDMEEKSEHFEQKDIYLQPELRGSREQDLKDFGIS